MPPGNVDNSRLQPGWHPPVVLMQLESIASFGLYRTERDIQIVYIERTWIDRVRCIVECCFMESSTCLGLDGNYRNYRNY